MIIQSKIDAVSDHIEDSLNIIHTLQNSEQSYKGTNV